MPDLAENKRERDNIDRGVKVGRDRLKTAKADPAAAFNQAMQQAINSGYEARLATRMREQRYQIFLDNMRQAEQRNSKAGPDEVHTVDYFSLFTLEELRSFRGMPRRSPGVGSGRRLLYNNPSMPMPCACGGPSERAFQYGAVNVASVPAVSWRNYMTPVRDQQSSSACGMFAVAATLEVGFYIKWNTKGWTTNHIDLSEKDLVSRSGWV